MGEVRGSRVERPSLPICLTAGFVALLLLGMPVLGIVAFVRWVFDVDHDTMKVVVPIIGGGLIVLCFGGPVTEYIRVWIAFRRQPPPPEPLAPGFVYLHLPPPPPDLVLPLALDDLTTITPTRWPRAELLTGGLPKRYRRHARSTGSLKDSKRRIVVPFVPSSARAPRPEHLSARQWGDACLRTLAAALNERGATFQPIDELHPHRAAARSVFTIAGRERRLYVFVLPHRGRVGLVLHLERAEACRVESKELLGLGVFMSRAGLAIQVGAKGSEIVARCAIDARGGLSVAAVNAALERLTATCEALEDLTHGTAWREALLPTSAELKWHPLRRRVRDPNYSTTQAYVNDEDELFDCERREIRSELGRREPNYARNCGWVLDGDLDAHPDLAERWCDVHRRAKQRAASWRCTPVAAVRARWLTARGWSIKELASS